MQISQERRDQIERSIVEIIATCIEKGILKDADLPPMVNFYGEKIDAAQTEEDLQVFVSELVQKWPVFAALQENNNTNSSLLNEQQITQDVLSLAKEGRLEEAVDLAKTVTDQHSQ